MRIEMIEKIDWLVRTKATGNSAEFAEKLGISTRTLFNYLNYMKIQMSAPIEYSKEHQSYIYNGNGGVKVGWHPESIEK
jgi:hypothetical protein